LYTTSCFAVINWSNSSIKTTLYPISVNWLIPCNKLTDQA
jgi:hypothetical protein